MWFFCIGLQILTKVTWAKKIEKDEKLGIFFCEKRTFGCFSDVRMKDSRIYKISITDCYLLALNHKCTKSNFLRRFLGFFY